MSAPRVLVVDDSAFVRKVVREILLAAGMDVVETARDGLDALEKIDAHRPDVVTLDLMMPHLDGVGVLEALATRDDAPAAVVVSISGADTEAGVTALQRGAIAVVEKPTALATARLYEIGKELVAQVRLAAGARRRRPRPAAPQAAVAIAPARAERSDVLVVGASTGGPQALTQLLGALPAAFPVPIAVVLHIPVGYTEALARRLDSLSALHVVEASEGQRLAPGTVTVARAGLHLVLRREGGDLRAHLDASPVSTLHRPSVDVLFESAAEACGPRALALVMTGMGDDGLAGARKVRERQGRILTESESSCVVFGMPRAVIEAGLSDGEAPLEALPELIVRSV